MQFNNSAVENLHHVTKYVGFQYATCSKTIRLVVVTSSEDAIAGSGITFDWLYICFASF